MKKKRNWTKTILFLAVLSVSILGISYAGWNDSLFMGTAISIGEIELSVISLEPIESLEENEKFTWPGGNADYFTATVNALAGKPEDPAFGLNLSVRNSGSLPVIIEGVTVDPGATGENIAVTAWRDNDGVYRLSLPYSTIYGNWQKTLNITGSVIINEIPAETTTRDAINLDIAENTFSENPKDYLDKNEGNNTAANTTTNTVSSEIADTIANEAAEADEQEPR